ncbi:MAG: glycosyltransferase family 2 protein, partial [Magnetococcales bacterium]|nr:glycosyltransferase family 2 protein [Magnetococcales bacterium]
MLRASIIIPTYHRPKELGDCLQSILRQTLLPFEVIVVDDGDLGGFPMREALEAAGIRCLYHKKEKPGLTASRNVGIGL